MIGEVAREILIKSKRKIFSQNLGDNSTTFVGNGLDFHELREYYFGDDVRKINWKATAKEQKPYINIFTEERELNIVLAFISSGSISFGSKRIKQELMSEIIALLSFSAIKNNDNVTTFSFSDKEDYIKKATKNVNSLYETIPKLLDLDTVGKEINFSMFNEYLLKNIKSKSIVFIVGDFFEDIDFSLISSKHEIYSIIVRDKFEEEPKLNGLIDLINPNNLSVTEFTLSKKEINNYIKEIKKRDAKLFKHFLANKIYFTKIYTDEDPFYKLNNLVR